MGGKLMIGAWVISSQLKQELSLPRVCEDSDLGLWRQCANLDSSLSGHRGKQAEFPSEAVTFSAWVAQ